MAMFHGRRTSPARQRQGEPTTTPLLLLLVVTVVVIGLWACLAANHRTMQLLQAWWHALLSTALRPAHLTLQQHRQQKLLLLLLLLLLLPQQMAVVAVVVTVVLAIPTSTARKVQQRVITPWRMALTHARLTIQEQQQQQQQARSARSP